MLIRLVGMLTGLTLAGCTNSVPGSAVDVGQLTARAALGDFATINYCSLIDQARLETKLGYTVGHPKPSFDYCSLSVIADDREVEVRVGPLANEETLKPIDRMLDPERHPPAGLQVWRDVAEEDHACIRYLEFVDKVSITIDVRAKPDGKGPHGASCAIADTTVDSVTTPVLANQVRHLTFENNSLGKLVACDLVPADLVADVLRLATSEPPVRPPSGHACQWGARGPSGPWAFVYFDIPFSGSIPMQGPVTQETIAGYSSLVTRSADERLSGCWLWVDTIPFREALATEIAVVQVVLTDKDKDACVPARELATAVWPKLPK